MLDQLKQYFNSTPFAEIKSEWQEIEKQFPSGINASEYLEYSATVNNPYYRPPIIPEGELLIAKNLTSNFSGSFFLLNLLNERSKKSCF
ncbi:MAG: hypothetical protein ACKOW2_01080 [Sphingobacteriaceae bacterium]